MVLNCHPTASSLKKQNYENRTNKMTKETRKKILNSFLRENLIDSQTMNWLHDFNINQLHACFCQYYELFMQFSTNIDFIPLKI